MRVEEDLGEVSTRSAKVVDRLARVSPWHITTTTTTTIITTTSTTRRLGIHHALGPLDQDL